MIRVIRFGRPLYVDPGGVGTAEAVVELDFENGRVEAIVQCRRRERLLPFDDPPDRDECRSVDRPAQRVGFVSPCRPSHPSGGHVVVGRPAVAVDEPSSVYNRERGVRKREVPTRPLPGSNRLRVDLVPVRGRLREGSIRSLDGQRLGGVDAVLVSILVESIAHLPDPPDEFDGRDVVEDVRSLLDDERFRRPTVRPRAVLAPIVLRPSFPDGDLREATACPRISRRKGTETEFRR